MAKQVESNKAEAPPTPPLTNEQVAAMLNRADIILTHSSDPTARAIQLVTHSYWNHVALVALLSDKATGDSQGYQRTFILEAEAKAGVDIHPLDKYFKTGKYIKKRQDLLILRLPAAALPAGQLGTEFLRRVRGFALEEIDARYCRGTILRLLEKGAGLLTWLLRPIIRAARVVISFNRNKAINEFICSGVVQHAYYRACFGADPTQLVFWNDFFQDPKRRAALIVDPDIRKAIDLQMPFDSVKEQLKVTVPGDFSRAAAAGWLQCVAQRIDGDWKTELSEV